MANEYCSLTDVQNEYKNAPTFDSASKPTSTAVETKITRYSRKMDSVLNKAYSVPITESASPNAYMVLTEICLLMVRSWLDPLLGISAKIDPDTDEPINMMKSAMDELNLLVENNSLDDAVLKTSSGITDWNSANNIKPTLDPDTYSIKDKDWW